MARWLGIWFNNPQKRPDREIKRRIDVVGTVLFEQNSEWTVALRYMPTEALGRDLTDHQKP